jgi:hypothetical protein
LALRRQARVPEQVPALAPGQVRLELEQALAGQLERAGRPEEAWAPRQEAVPAQAPEAEPPD